MKIIIQVSSVNIFKVIVEEIYNKKKIITVEEVIAILDNRGIPYLTEFNNNEMDKIILEFDV